jgi:hypothetical protein
MLSMRRLTRNEMMNTYWQYIHEIASTGFVPFIIRGSLCWESPSDTVLQSSSEGIWLKSDCYDPTGKPITDEPIKVHLQWHLNYYDIWGGLAIDVDPQSEEMSKTALEQAIQDIYLLCNLISLTGGVSVTWYPARLVNAPEGGVSLPSQAEHQADLRLRLLPLPRAQEERVGTRVQDEYVADELYPLFHHARSIKNNELGALVRRALSWHATGNYIGSGLNRFVNYWESVELLAHFFYRKLPRELTNRPSKSDKKDQVLQILERPPTRRNCLEIAQQCGMVVPPLPSARTVLEATLPVITGQADSAEPLFAKNEEGGKCLYDIRNDIAHGNHCDHELEFTDLVDERLQVMRRISRDVLWQTLHRIPFLEKYCQS